MNTAEQERLDHLDELQAELNRRYRLALLERALVDGDREALAELLGQPCPKPKAPGLARAAARKAVKTIAVQTAAGLLADLLVPSLGPVAGKLIGDIADAIT